MLLVVSYDLKWYKALKEYISRFGSCKYWYPMEYCTSYKMWMCWFVYFISASTHLVVYCSFALVFVCGGGIGYVDICIPTQESGNEGKMIF